jgi:hypothetical protein
MWCGEASRLGSAAACEMVVVDAVRIASRRLSRRLNDFPPRATGSLVSGQLRSSVKLSKAANAHSPRFL